MAPEASEPASFTVLYRWRLRAGHEGAFVDAWSRVSDLLRASRGSLGSRLHRGSDGIWYSYARWPSAQARSKAFALGPVDAAAGQQMEQAVEEHFPEIILEAMADFMLPGGRNGV
jgi:heme-degrading monooxygenase HmoA